MRTPASRASYSRKSEQRKFGSFTVNQPIFKPKNGDVFFGVKKHQKVHERAKRDSLQASFLQVRREFAG